MSIDNYDHVNTVRGRAGSTTTGNAYHNRTSRHVGGQAQEVRQAVVDEATQGDTYTVTLDGVVKSVEAPSASKNAIIILLLLALEAVEALYSKFEMVEHPDFDDRILVTHRQLGESFTLTTGAKMTASVITDANSGTEIPPGVFVMQDPNDPDGALLPSLEGAEAQVTHLTPANVTDTDKLRIVVTGDFDGDGETESFGPFEFTAGGADDVQSAVEGLGGAGKEMTTALAIVGVVVTEDDAKLIFTGPASGIPFEVRAWTQGADGGDGTTTWTLDEDTAAKAATLTSPLIGAVMLDQNQEAIPNSDEPMAYKPGAEMTISEVESGFNARLDAGVTVKPGDPVYVRAAGSGQRGVSRPDSGGGEAVLHRGARFTTANRIGFDGNNIATISLEREQAV